MSHDTTMTLTIMIWNGVNLILVSYFLYLMTKNYRANHLNTKHYDLSINRSEGKR